VPVIRKLALIAVLFCVPSVLLAQPAADKAPVIKKSAAPTVTPVDGKQMYESYCSACHGKAGKGDGPAAPALSPRPTDITQYSKKHGGAFPAKDFEDKLNGAAMAPAHGNSEMPVWGPILRQMGNDTLRFYNLRKYVETLQAP